MTGAPYNLGGGRFSHCSILEAVQCCERIAGRPLYRTYVEEPRRGDHICSVSDLSRFQVDYPAWSPRHRVPRILREIYDSNAGLRQIQC